jgi:hypothetical protein
MGRFDIRTRTGLIAPIIQGLSALSYDADAQAFFDRVTAAGGTLSTTEKDAVSTLVLSLKINSLWTSMVAIYPMVGASAAACAQNLKSSSYTGTFSSGWTFASTGATPNGTNAFMDTALVPNSILTQNSSHLSFYSRSNVAASVSTEIGSLSNAGPSYFQLYAYYTGNIYYNLLATSTVVSVANTNSLGFFNGNRNSSTNISNFKNGTNLGNVTSISVGLNNKNVYVGALNNDGTITSYSTKECAFASIGAGLSDTQAANFYTNVQTFQTSLSRNV